MSLGHGNMCFQETALLLCGLLRHLCARCNWDGRHSLLATVVAPGTVVWEQGVFQTKVLPLARGFCCVGCEGDRLLGS